MANLVRHLMELAAEFNAVFIDSNRDEETKPPAAIAVFFEWPDGDVIETEIFSWVGGYIFDYNKFIEDAPKGRHIHAGYLSVEGAYRGWLENDVSVINFKKQHQIYDMCRDSYIAKQFKCLSHSITNFRHAIDDDPALMELLSDD